MTGGGVKALVLDDGIDIRHEDLAANVDHSMLRNFDPKAPDPGDPMPLGIGDAHGTAVAGIIAAASNNGVGGRGVAPSASLGSINYLCDDCISFPNLLAAYGGAPYSREPGSSMPRTAASRRAGRSRRRYQPGLLRSGHLPACAAARASSW